MKLLGIKIKIFQIYLPGETYEDFFYRKHGFKHTDQATEARTINTPTNHRITELEKELEKLFKRIKLYETITSA